MPSELITLIQTVGIPTGILVYVLVRGDHFLKALIEEIRLMRKEITEIKTHNHALNLFLASERPETPQPQEYIQPRQTVRTRTKRG